MNCDNCECYVKVGETWVPYGDTTVKYSDDWGCGKGLSPEDCLDDSHHTVRSYNRRDEEQDEWGDWAGHLDREDGR